MFIIQVQELHLMTFFRDSLLVVHFLNPSVILAKKPDKLKIFYVCFINYLEKYITGIRKMNYRYM